MANYKKTSTTDLVQIFAKAAAEQGEALRAADPKKANSRYRTMEKTYLELKSRGPAAQTEVLSLFGHPAEKAALAATDRAKRQYEYGGWILKNKDGRYTYTIAVTFKDQGHFYPDNVTIPKNFKRVAIYHTHPYSDRAEGQGLSAGDEQHAYDHHRAVYEADTYTRNMYRFTPGVSAYKANEWCCGVIGDFVAHIPQ